MEIDKMSLEQLKALAYDEARKLEIARNNLSLLNQKIVDLEKTK